MSSLFDQYISNTYTGVLHAGGAAIPASSKAIIYDGAGNQTDLELGRDGTGIAITGPSTVSGTFTVSGVTTINNNASVTGTFTVGGTTTINNLLSVGGNLVVNGSTATINATLNVDGDITVSGGTVIEGTTNINAPLNVEGTATVGDLKVGDLSYPNNNQTPGNLLVVNNDGSTIVTADPDSIIISDDDLVITRTTYTTTPNVVVDTLVFNSADDYNKWYTVNLEDIDSFWNSAKAAILFAELNDWDLPAGNKVTLVASPNKNDVYKVWSWVSVESDDQTEGMGVQFCAPIGKGNTHNGKMYFKFIPEGSTSDVTFTIDIYAIAKQR